MAEVATADVTVAPIDEMDPIHGGVGTRSSFRRSSFRPRSASASRPTQPGSQPSRYRLGFRCWTRA
jgi:hypothetical protein